MISIIGAGPVGCYTGYLLAKAGKKVQIFEEHKEIGIPIQCTGIVTKDIFNFINYNKKIFINKLEKVK
jgi:flavin-dependent dehydrogenase